LLAEGDQLGEGKPSVHRPVPELPVLMSNACE